MKTLTKPIEATGVIEKANRLLFDEPIPIEANSRVRVLIMPEYEEITEEEWLQAAARNPAFADLNDPAEDIYSPDEGVPFDEEG